MATKQAAYGQPAVYNAVPPTWQDGEPAALQIDQNGYLLVSGVTGGGGGVSAKYNVTPPVYTDGGTATLQTDVNGNLKVVTSGASGYSELTTTSPATGGLSLGRYKATAPTLTDGQMYGLELDVNGNLKESMATRLDAVNDAVTSYPYGHSYTNITTNATTTVKSGSGVLKAIKINNPSALTVANLTLTVYDNTAGSGTVIATITVPFGQSGALPIALNFDAAFATGLTIVTAGPTVAANVTVEWR